MIESNIEVKLEWEEMNMLLNLCDTPIKTIEKEAIKCFDEGNREYELRNLKSVFQWKLIQAKLMMLVNADKCEFHYKQAIKMCKMVEKELVKFK